MSDDPALGAYLGVVERLSSLVRDRPTALDETVPACPEWTVREVLAHLAGLAEDWVAGRLDHYATEAWTTAQVERFDDVPVEEVLDRWSTAAGRFGQLAESPLGGTPARWAFGDAATHEADLRAVLDPGSRLPPEALALALQGGVSRWRQELSAAGVAPLDVVANDVRTWRVGDHDADAESVTTTGHELWRGLFGRRTRAQVESWEWTCDPAPYLDVGLPFPFRWSARPLAD